MHTYVHMYVCVWRVNVSGFSHSPSAFTGRIWDAYCMGDCGGVTSPLHCDVHQGHPHGTENKYLQEVFHNPHPNSDSIYPLIYIHKCNSGRQQAAHSYLLHCLQDTHMHAHMLCKCVLELIHMYIIHILLCNIL